MEKYKELLICPECGAKVKNIIAHAKIHHNEIVDKKSFLMFYPNYDQPFQIDTRTPKDLECPICHVHYQYNNSLGLHLKKCHYDYWVSQGGGQDNRKCAKIECPICHNKCSDIKQHTHRKHQLEWEVFCKLYNWDIKNTKYVSNEYRKSLSDNKKKFYRTTERGKELRELQSIKWTENNVAKDPKVKEKSMNTRSKNGKIPKINYHGIHISYNKNKSFRSFNEFTVWAMCNLHKINVDYENTKYIVKWYNEEGGFMSTYTPDFYIEGIGLVELKDVKRAEIQAKKEEKYIKVSKIYKSIGIPFNVYSQKHLFDVLGINEKKYIINSYLKNLIDEAIKTDNIRITCRENSKIIKEMTDCEDLNSLHFVTIIKKHEN